jgi:GTP-binding protein
MAQRVGDMKNMRQTKNGMQFEYEISTANLIGYRNELLVATSGEGVINTTFLEYRPLSKRAEWHRGGAVVEHETGKATAYSIEKAQQRAKLLVNPGEEIYAGQVVGITNRPEDIYMNLAKGKKLTNMRAAGADILVVLTPALKPSLEQFLNLIGDDEMLEVTPGALRLRKKDLTIKH